MGSFIEDRQSLTADLFLVSQHFFNRELRVMLCFLHNSVYKEPCDEIEESEDYKNHI